MDEIVQLYDERHRATGTARRSRVRRENLRHGATGVVVRDPLGRVYVHRRTDTKDVYPGMHDCATGGVMLAGEAPDAAARREAAEELGVRYGALLPIGSQEYSDAYTTYVGFMYEIEYDGPIRWQPEEVAWGAWMTLEELAERLDDPHWPFVPDTRALIGPWVAERLADKVVNDDGWDSAVTLAEGRWVDRVPRRTEVARWLLAETRLMPRLAPLVPLDVPVPAVMYESPLRVRHRIVDGTRAGDVLTYADGETVGRFLRALHDAPVSLADDTGVRNASAAAAELETIVERFYSEVLPRVPDAFRVSAEQLLRRVVQALRTSIVHGDLGPAHVLATGGRVSGVIDWADAHIGDPAMDLAWALYGGAPEFAAGVTDAYGVSRAERERALDWHLLGPWHEVTYGLDTGRDELVESGMRGVVARLESLR